MHSAFRQKGAKEARGVSTRNWSSQSGSRLANYMPRGSLSTTTCFIRSLPELKIHGATAATVKRIYYSKGSDHKSLESLVAVVKTLRQLGGETQARAWVRERSKNTAHREIVTDLILEFSLNGKNSEKYNIDISFYDVSRQHWRPHHAPSR